MALWSHSEGERPNTVVVYERKPGGVIYVRAWDANAARGKGNFRRRSLGHRNKVRAKRYAREQVKKLEDGTAALDSNTNITLAHLFAMYEQFRTPKKSLAHQDADRRRIEMWSRFLGSDMDPNALTKRQWESFIELRGSGAIDPRGNPVAEKDRKPVRTRGVEIDLVWLRAVYAWGETWDTDDEQFLLRRNPTRGFDIPREKNPRRGLASQDRYEALRAISDEHTFEARWTGKRTKVRSYLSEILDLVNETGRRIGAICALRYQDLRLNDGGNGAICWPADTEKTKRETNIPISAAARAAIDRILRERPGIGAAPLFPAPGDPGVPVDPTLVRHWLTAVERKAGIEPMHGRRYHAYRAKWVTERKNFPDVDQAAAGGWKSVQTLKIYQHPDNATMLEVVESPRRLREVKKNG